MATRRLFDEDPALMRFAARVVAVADGGRAVALDATAFFPEEGGQRCDGGRLDSVALADVTVDEDGTIWHRLESAASWEPGATVEGWVDEPRRRDHRQQHTGQHLLSRAFVDLFGAETHGFHMGANLSTIDVAIDELDRARARQVLDCVHAWILEDLPIETAETPRPGNRPLLTVAIGQIDRQPCCGTHARRTGEIGAIQILRWEKTKGLTRVSFVCGGRAHRFATDLLEAADEASRICSVGWMDLPRAVEAMQEEAKQAQKNVRDWRRRWAAIEADRLARETPRRGDGLLVVASWIDGADAEMLRTVAQAIQARGRSIAILGGSGDGDLRPWLVAGSDDLPAEVGFDARTRLQEILTPLGGRGGGKERFAQGTCRVDEAQCRSALERAARV